ncbi:hypothetical protein Rs2_18405 [Raphanus sativus]|nr:hypothetical protein Rs2_18405 [Raphanus sativus]
MASYKGNGILLLEDDDEPIQSPDQADEHLIQEYSMSLIGKILNPKKKNVERLIVAMPEQWGMSEKISACDLCNGCFLFNFDMRWDTRDAGSQVISGNTRSIDASYRSHKNGMGSHSRVQRSSHSNRMN